MGPGLGRPPRSPLPSGAGPAASVKSPQARAAAGSTGRCSQRRWVGQAGPPCREEFGRETEQPGAGSQGRWGRDLSDGWARLTQPGQAAARGVVERRQAGRRLRSALRAERRLFGRAARAPVLPAVLPPPGRRVCRVCMRKNSQGFPARAARPGGPLRPAEALPQGPPEAVQFLGCGSTSQCDSCPPGVLLSRSHSSPKKLVFLGPPQADSSFLPSTDSRCAKATSRGSPAA